MKYKFKFLLFFKRMFILNRDETYQMKRKKLFTKILHTSCDHYLGTRSGANPIKIRDSLCVLDRFKLTVGN
jgi:hypothetical protein